MKISCPICLDLYTASDEITAAPCGHVFHTVCCNRWFESNKHSCPACRKSCPKKELRRIFFSEGASADASESESDVSNLINKVDTLTFNLRLCETEKKKIFEDRDNLAAKNAGLRDECKALERKIAAARDEMFAANEKVKSLKADKRNIDLMQRDLNDTKHQLELYKTIDVAVKGSLEEVTHRLHQIGDYSQAAKDLSLISIALKKEMKNKSDYEARLQKELAQKTRTITELKATLEAQSREIKVLTDTNKSLKSDVKHLEDELEQTKSKMLRLQEAIVSPSGDVKSSAINRLIFEHPAPMNLTMLEESPPTQTTASKKKSSMSDFFEMSDDDGDESKPGFNPAKKKKLASPCKEVTNSLRKPSTFVRSGSSGLTGLLGTMASSSDGFRCQPRLPGKTEGMHFDGLGGHGKVDLFPQPLKRDFKLKPPSFSKKPKGVSRPKAATTTSASQLASQNLATIDKFFSLDTP